MTPLFFFNSVLLGAGLAMDAFSVSIANGLLEPRMRRAKACTIAGVFGFFQFLMPMTGWVCVHYFVQAFKACAPFIPWIALALLCCIGFSMIQEGLGGEEEDEGKPASDLGFKTLLIQGIATSIDALSVGFAIERMSAREAFIASLIIAAVTFAICHAGVTIGKKFGLRLASKATVLGGLILIGIGIEILASSLL